MSNGWFETVWKLASDNHEVLAALSGLGASIAALFAIVISVYSLAVQRRRNRLSVRPIAHFGYVDYENELSIWLRNSGVGPMKIDAITVRCVDSGLVKTTLYEQVSDKAVTGSWTFYSGNLKGRIVRAGGVLHLLKLKGDLGDSEFVAKREATRRALLALELKVSYSDIYGRTIGTEVRELGWFGRHYFQYDFATRTLIRH